MIKIYSQETKYQSQVYENKQKQKRTRKQHFIMLYSNNNKSTCVVLTNETLTVFAEFHLKLKFRSKIKMKYQLQVDGN